MPLAREQLKKPIIHLNSFKKKETAGPCGHAPGRDGLGTESGSVSRILYSRARGRERRSFIWDGCCQPPQAPYPEAAGGPPVASLSRSPAPKSCPAGAEGFPDALRQSNFWSLHEGGSGPRFPIWACSGRGLASRHVTMSLVGSYPTISPLPGREPGPPVPFEPGPTPGRSCPRPRKALQPEMSCPAPVRGAPGGVVSVPLSVGSPLPAVSRRPALWSSDFPRKPSG